MYHLPLPRPACRAVFAVTVAFTLVTPGLLRAEPPVVVESPTAATAGKATLTITENNKTQTVEAEGRDVAVEGHDNKITVSGKCHALTVSGSNNVVTAGSVFSVSTPGNHNRVTYTQASGGESVQVTNVGAGNEVSKKSE